MRRILLIPVSLVLLLAVATPALAATEVQTFTTHSMHGPIQAATDGCPEACTEYLLSAASIERTPEQSFACLEVNTYTSDGVFTERGCGDASDVVIVASGKLTLTLLPIDITLDSGRTVTVSATATSISRPLTEKFRDQFVDADGCTVTTKVVSHEAEFSALATVTVDGISADGGGTVFTSERKITTRC